MGYSLKNIRGRIVSKNVTKYLIDWEKPSRSKIQFAVKQFFKPYWIGSIIYEEFPVYGTRLKVDLLNATKKIAVEINGNQHNKFNKFFHNNSRENFKKSIKRDFQKLEWLEMNGFTVIEINEDEVPLISEEFIKEKFDIDLI